MKIAIIGLGKMGMQIARKLAEGGHEVIGFDVGADAITEASNYGVTGFTTEQEVADAFKGEPAAIWLMIPSEYVDKSLDSWLSVLPKGSLIVDGGNSDFRLTKERAAKTAAAGIELVDVGTSGGVWGYQYGFSMMAGGNKAAYDTVEPVIKTLALPAGAYNYFGASGAGHYTKMVHNAIEYGIMESLAEGYRMLKEGPYDGLDLAAAGEVWQHHSVITSWLNELAQSAVAENPDMEGIDGFVVESGEARWTLEVAKEKGIGMPAIQSSFDVRLASQKGEVNYATKLLAAMRNKFGGHQINKT